MSNQQRETLKFQVVFTNLEMNVKFKGYRHQIRIFARDISDLASEHLLSDEAKRISSMVTGHGRYGRTQETKFIRGGNSIKFYSEVSTLNPPRLLNQLERAFSSPRRLMAHSYLGNLIVENLDKFDVPCHVDEIESTRYLSNKGNIVVNIFAESYDPRSKYKKEGAKVNG